MNRSYHFNSLEAIDRRDSVHLKNRDAATWHFNWSGLMAICAILAFPNVSSATTYEWRGDFTELFENLEEACQSYYQRAIFVDARNDPPNIGCHYYTTYDFCEKSIVGTDPPSSALDRASGIVHFTVNTPPPFQGPTCGTSSQAVGRQKNYQAEGVPDSFFLIVPPPLKSEPNSCSAGSGALPSVVADPINPASGSVLSREGDCQGRTGVALPFTRYYDSSDSALTNLGPGWRGSFSRRIVPITFSVTLHSYVPGSPDNSSLYGNEETTCASGFAQIQSRVPNWVGATTQYLSGICQLIKNGVVIGSIPIYSNNRLPTPFPMPIAYDATRDDGQVIHFTVQGGGITSPPTIILKLQKTGSGYSLVDANDNVEAYDANGVLQFITSRAGVTQTMSYDASNRLSSITDSFGHQLTLTYDAQNRLISVTRQ